MSLAVGILFSVKTAEMQRDSREQEAGSSVIGQVILKIVEKD
jgi:hypothetical protein